MVVSPPPTKRLHSHDGGSQSSFSSSSSCSSPSFRSNSFPCSNPYDLSSSPLSPLPSFHISRVPFSWEQQPGIPKKHHSSKSSSDESLTMLPLPPSASTTPTKRFNLDTIFTIRRKSSTSSSSSSGERDPFTAALLECCKDVDDHQEQEDVEKYWKVSRVISDRFGFMDRYTSCKKSCAVAESVILLQRSIRKA